jgi:hypothetical protein
MTDEKLKQAAKDLANARHVLLSDGVAVDPSTPSNDRKRH